MTAAPSLSPAIAIRPATQDDAGYVVSSWLREYGHSSAYAEAMGTPFWKHHHDTIARILATATVTVACAVEEPDTIIGYSVIEPVVSDEGRETLVHWIHVRKEFRGHGIARQLLGEPSGRIVATHITRKVRVPRGWQVDLYKGIR